MTLATNLLTAIGGRLRDAYHGNRRVLSFAQYLALVVEAPRRHLRAAPQYAIDAFDHFGWDEATYPWGKERRCRLFDAPWAGGDGQLFGHEHVQQQVYKTLQSFARDGRANRVIMLHGPNGSAKSTFLRCLGEGLETYAATDAGALYRFSWVFPSKRTAKGGIGFGHDGGALAEAAVRDSFAFLPDDDVDARVGDELRDHPLLLVPADERRPLLEELAARIPDFVVSDYLRYGELSAKNRGIYEALLASYQGDYLAVLRHVQVQRFYISRRYRTGWATVEPQLSVDAHERQVTADRSIAALPASLQTVALYDYGGELVGANRGLIEFDDLLKRPLEAFKYLLTTVERGAVALPTAHLELDLVFVASCNEIHLAAFRDMPDFQSFRGRFELVRVPYLLDVRHEAALYQRRLAEIAKGRHVAPHTAWMVALFAVLSRMRKPQLERYPSTLAEPLGKLTPLEKLELYAFGTAPKELSPARGQELVAHVRDLWLESETYPNYEGRSGASPRELQSVLLAAASSNKFAYVSPLVVLDELGELIRQVGLYDFLRQEAQPGGFHDHRTMLDTLRLQLLDRIDDDVRASLGLIDDGEAGRVFERYLAHVTPWINKEKVRNASTGRLEEPDEAMMREVETMLDLTGSVDDIRRGWIAKIGAWSIDHKGTRPEPTRIFADAVRKLRDAYYARHREAIAHAAHDLMAVLTEQAGHLSPEARATAQAAQVALTTRLGYRLDSARDLLGMLIAARYRRS